MSVRDDGHLVCVLHPGNVTTSTRVWADPFRWLRLERVERPPVVKEKP